MNRFVDRDMFMRFRGGGVSHQVTREWDEFLQNDGAVVSIDDGEDVEFELGGVGDDDEVGSSVSDEDAIDEEDQIRRSLMTTFSHRRDMELCNIAFETHTYHT